MQLIEEIRRIAAEKQSAMCRLADEVWQAAELNWRETKSADATARALEAEGFAVTRAAAGLATALEARYGSEGPVIGFLGEYDALDGLSQARTGSAEGRWMEMQQVYRGLQEMKKEWEVWQR